MTDRIATLSQNVLSMNSTTAGGSSSAAPVFDLVLGPENSLVSFAADLCTAEPTTSSEDTTLDGNIIPLTFYAPSGYGKSRLLQTLAANWSQNRASENLLLFEAADFARSYAQAVKLDDIQRFQQRFQRIGLLLIDNLDDLRRKTGAQQHLATIIDHRQRQCRPTVLTIRKNKIHTAGLSYRLMSRINGGLCVPIELPGSAATAQILEQLSQLGQFQITAEAKQEICQQGPMSVPQLAGLVNRILVEQPRHLYDDEQPTNRVTIRVQDVQPAIENLANQQFDVRTVIRLTASYFGLQPRNLTSKSRRKLDVLARSTAMYLVRQHTTLSYQQIGDRFGKRDHTTVMHACNKIEAERTTNSSTRNSLSDLEQRLNITH